MNELLVAIQSVDPGFQNAAGQWLGMIVLCIPFVRFLRLQYSGGRRQYSPNAPRAAAVQCANC